MLQPPPKALKIDLRQFFAHIPFTLPEPDPKKSGKAAMAPQKGG
jgi:hypothetical protein